jgi:two-component system cell cycle sensor histidine kinase/response regulator CckA
VSRPFVGNHYEGHWGFPQRPNTHFTPSGKELMAVSFGTIQSRLRLLVVAAVVPAGALLIHAVASHSTGGFWEFALGSTLLLTAILWWAVYQFLWRPVKSLVQALVNVKTADSATAIEVPSQPGVLGPLARALDEYTGELRRREQDGFRNQQEITRLNRALKALSRVNHAVIHASDEAELLQSVCQFIVSEGRYRFCWVGFAEQDQEKTVRPAAYAGFEGGYLKSAKVSWADTERGRGPGGTAVRTGRYCVVRNIKQDRSFTPWADEASKRGYQSVLALPLLRAGKAFGCVCIYAAESGAFDEPEIELLQEMASDLSYGIVALRAQKEWKSAQEQLRLTRYSIDHSGDAAFWVGPDGSFLDVNGTACKLLGYSRQELLGMKVPDINPGISRDRWPEHWKRVEPGHSLTMEAGLRTRQGALVPVEMLISHVAFDGKEYHCVLARDITERKQAEERLRLQIVALESAANSIVITDVEGRIQWINAAFTKLTGYSRDEALGRKPSLLKSGCHDELFYRHLWATIRSGQTWRGEITNRRKDGRLYIEEMTITPVLDERGEITHFIGIKQDVTTRKEDEQKLLQSEERFRLAFEKGPLGIIMVKPDLSILKVNRALCDMLGYSEAELLRCSVRDITHPEERDHDQQLLQQIFSGQLSNHKWTKRYVKKNGETLVVDITHSLILQQNGTPLYSLGIVENVTERRRAELLLIRKTHELQTVFRALPDLYFRLRRDGTILDYLSGANRPLYTSPDKFMGRKMQDILPEEAGKKFEQAFCLVGQAEAPVVVDYALAINGKELLFEARLSLLQGDEIVALIRDVTEHRRLEEQFRQAQKMEAVGRLAGGVAHDFNNMLGVIMGYTQLLQQRLSQDEAASRHLGEVRKAADRAAALTRQLLAFSRKQVLHLSRLDLNAVVSDLSKMLTRIIGDDVELTIRQGKSLGHVMADPTQIEQILMNLAVNARDAMPRGGQLLIETGNAELDESYARLHRGAVPGSYVMLAVSDTGCGMDSETQARIFEPFFTTKEAGHGTGLGLSTVYGVVKQSGGYIWVYSEPGKGTTFRIYLPRVDRGVALALPPSSSETMAAARHTILLVEDEGALREIARTLLEGEGFTVLAAHNGVEAMDLARREGKNIDLLLTDVVMPGMSGRELAERLTEMYPALKVLYMSGYTDDFMNRHGVLEHEVPLVEKPFTRESLLANVRTVLSSKARAAAT